MPATDAFTFEANGKEYVLPNPTECMVLLPGRALRDALLEDTDGQGELRLAFRCLESGVVEQGVLDALYDLPIMDMARIVGTWFNSAKVDGATVPESMRS